MQLFTCEHVTVSGGVVSVFGREKIERGVEGGRERDAGGGGGFNIRTRVHKNKSMQHHTSGSGTAEFQVT